MAVTLPSINITFQQLAGTFIQRSARGIAVLIIRDDTVGTGETFFRYGDATQVSAEEFTAANQQYIKDALFFGPLRVSVVKIGSEGTLAQALAILVQQEQTGWITLTDGKSQDWSDLASWIKAREGEQKSWKAVCYNTTPPDCKHVVNFATETVILVIAVCAFVIALVWHQVENGYQQAEQYIMAGEVTAAANKLEKIPVFYKEQTLLSRYAQLCMLSEEGTASDHKESLDELEQILKESPVELRPAMRIQYDLILSRYKDLLYADALKWLDQKQYRAAQDALKQVREYPHVAELLRFVSAVEAAQSAHSSFLLKSLQTSFETIPLDYAGPQAEEIAAFRIELSTMIHSAELREAMEQKAEEERIAALKASGIPYVGMLEDEVNSTRQLGKAYRSGTNRERVKLSDGSYGQKEWQYYCWYSKSDGDIVFKAECEGGLVFNVVKYGGDACWDGDKLKIKLGPQKIQTFNSGGASNLPPSVRGDYDNPVVSRIFRKLVCRLRDE